MSSIRLDILWLVSFLSLVGSSFACSLVYTMTSHVMRHRRISFVLLFRFHMENSLVECLDFSIIKDSSNLPHYVYILHCIAEINTCAIRDFTHSHWKLFSSLKWVFAKEPPDLFWPLVKPVASTSNIVADRRFSIEKKNSFHSNRNRRRMKYIFIIIEKQTLKSYTQGDTNRDLHPF